MYHVLSQGMFSDPTLLDISDVELVDIKFLEDDPVVVVQFNCQQARSLSMVHHPAAFKVLIRVLSHSGDITDDVFNAMYASWDHSPQANS